jgi:uncharacterized phage protein (TIGR01671 family)
MNRLIKFRVWDKETKQWIKSLAFISSYFDVIDSTWEFYDYYYKGLTSGFILQQFTGYLDKNKNPIFEGDIVRTDAEHITYCLGGVPLYTKGEVMFVNAGFNVCQAHIGRTHFEDFVTCDCCSCGLEIIGNIFENKDLCAK